MTITGNQTVTTELRVRSSDDTANSFVTIESWQVTPSLTWDFAKDWQVRAFVSYGESKDEGINGARQHRRATTRIAASSATAA